MKCCYGKHDWRSREIDVMKMSPTIGQMGLLLSGLAASAALVGGCSPPGEREVHAVHNLKVVTDAVPDMTSLDALLKEIIQPGMTDEAKCTAVWRTVHEYRFANASSCGNLAQVRGTDPILIFNCFAPTICQQDAEMCVAMWSACGWMRSMLPRSPSRWPR